MRISDWSSDVCSSDLMLIMDPKIILMDEPFSALDIQTRQLMENELLDLWSADRKSVLFITHDLDEAIAMSDRVIVLSAGPGTHPIGDFRKIGRASCREGVCQYV